MTGRYDLHIHSCLSPCGDEEMTPNNIVGMAQVLELQILAVSDHNTARQLPAVEKLCKEAGILFVPAIEISTAEEAHILSLFPDVQSALAMGEEVYEALPPVKNKPEIFGNQFILDENDEKVGELEKLLINATTLPIGEVFKRVRAHGGVPVPAHIDKNSYSVISSLGMIPPELGVRAVEVSDSGVKKGYCPPEEGYFVLNDSDAHCLDVMCGHEAEEIELERWSVRALLELLRGG